MCKKYNTELEIKIEDELYIYIHLLIFFYVNF